MILIGRYGTGIWENCSLVDPHWFYADPDPDSAFLANADPDLGFWWSKIKENYCWKKIYICWIKIPIYLRHSCYRRSQILKFLDICVSFLPSWIRIRINRSKWRRIHAESRSIALDNCNWCVFCISKHSVHIYQPYLPAYLPMSRAVDSAVHRGPIMPWESFLSVPYRTAWLAGHTCGNTGFELRVFS